jgi:hypothetical protein
MIGIAFGVPASKQLILNTLSLCNQPHKSKSLGFQTNAWDYRARFLCCVAVRRICATAAATTDHGSRVVVVEELEERVFAHLNSITAKGGKESALG